MRKRACVAATSLMAGRASGLSEPERLELEQHLESCSACAADEYDLYRLVVGTGAREIPLLNDRARSRAISGALRHATQANDDAPASRAWLRWLLPTATVAAAAAAFAIVVLTGTNQTGSSGPVVSAHLVLSGAVETHSDVLRAGMSFDSDTRLSTHDGARIAVGHATVALDADTIVAWNADSSTLTLRDGAVRASVDPRPKLPFRVRTDEFSVEVLGTKFEVTDSGVTVFEGHVRVTDSEGEVLLDDLGAGEAWHVPDELAQRPKRAHKRRAHVAARVEPDRPDPAELIEQARAHIAAGEVVEARTLLDDALDITREVAQKAEARTLLAECALVEGNHREAIRLYRRVADRYRKMRAGETALFAAARVETRDGHADRARELLQLYLERYPGGRFAEEATSRLEELTADGAE